MTEVSRQAGAKIDIKIADIPDVREWCEGLPVELWFNRKGRVVLKAWNEDGYNHTEVDVFDLIKWLDAGSALFAVRSVIGSGEHPDAGIGTDAGTSASIN